MSQTAQRLDQVRARIAAACERGGRSVGSVTLVAVSKTFPAARVDELLACGQGVFGENRVQEALGKMPDVTGSARWHLVGHLQRNKARHAVGVFELIHSVDGVALAQEIDRRAAALGIRQPVLLQVNLAGEASKHGAGARQIEALLEQAAALEHLEVQGLMAIPPPVERAEDSRASFAGLRDLRDRLVAASSLALPELSMGMTGDFEVAIEEGATMVRVGRALFGERG